jgi:hypothetical protein
VVGASFVSVGVKAFFAGHIEASAGSELFHRFNEVQVVVLHEKTQRRAMRAASKAVIELLVWHYIE